MSLPVAATSSVDEEAFGTSNSNEETQNEDDATEAEESLTATTTAAAQAKKPLRLGKKARVRTNRGKLLRAGLDEDQMSTIPEGSSRDFQLYGTITDGNGKDGYIVEFDIFPEANKSAKLMSGRLTPVEIGGEEPSESVRSRKKREVRTPLPQQQQK